MEKLQSLTVKEKGSLLELSCHICLLNQDHLYQVARLQESVIETMEKRELFFPLTHDELKYILSEDGGLGIGAFVQDKLIGFRCLCFPRNVMENLGRDIGLPDESLNQVVHLEASFVHADYQGNSLQKNMTRLSLTEINSINQQQYLFSTVMPENIPSIIDKFSHNMSIVALKEKYGSGLRYIFFRNLLKDQEEYCEDKQSVFIQNTDIDSQLTLLEDGYKGIGFEKSANGHGIKILYVKAL